MPAGIVYDNAASYVALGVVKAAVYTGYAAFLNLRLNGKHAAPLVGFTRTAIGMAVGGAYFWALLQITGRPPPETFGFLTYWATFVPIRIAEWWLLLRIFYLSRREMDRGVGPILCGVAVSYVADLPAAFGWLVTGGLWMC